MKSELPSLITPDAQAGMVLATKLANQLQTQFADASNQVERPGGTNYALPAPVPREVIGSILFYAIAAANHGWTSSS